jgi:hypothetical protein
MNTDDLRAKCERVIADHAEDFEENAAAAIPIARGALTLLEENRAPLRCSACPPGVDPCRIALALRVLTLVEGNTAKEILRAVRVGLAAWEDGESVVTMNGAPIGATVAMRRLEQDRWWPDMADKLGELVCAEILKRGKEEEDMP